MAGPRRGGRGAGGSYNRIDQPSGGPVEHNLNEPLDPSDGGGDAASADVGGGPAGAVSAASGRACRRSGLTPPDESEGGIVVVVLDTRQKKFRVGADPDWTVSQFKEHSATVHRVPANSQRLIYMGKLLADDRTLRQQDLVESEKIVHLFPKPNVVLASGGGSGGNAASGCNDDDGDGRSDGEEEDEEDAMGHIPQIVVDPEHHSQMIVTTNELFEAQHRVKLLSFLLLIICSMELLTLMTIFLGPDDPNAGEERPPGDPTDYQPQNAEEVQMREWRTSDYFDVVLSSCGFYVSLLGLRASTENTLDGAKKYFVGLVGVGIAWLGYYYYLSLDQVRKAQEAAARVDCDDDATGDGGGGGDGDSCGGSGSDSSGGGDASVQSDPYSIYTQAAFGLALPIIVWLLCFLRAWQFRVLIREAELEAEERHREQTERLRRAAAGDGGDGGGVGASPGGGDDSAPAEADGTSPSTRLVRRGHDDEDLGDLRLTQSVVIV